MRPPLGHGYAHNFVSDYSLSLADSRLAEGFARPI